MKEQELNWNEDEMMLYFAWHCTARHFNDIFGLDSESPIYQDYRNRLPGLPISQFSGKPKIPENKIREFYKKNLSKSCKVKK